MTFLYFTLGPLLQRDHIQKHPQRTFVLLFRFNGPKHNRLLYPL